jgi:hypothetical protein
VAVYGTVHVVGSNDDHAVWFTDRTDAGGTPVPETRQESGQRVREYTKREAANLDWLDTLFDTAERTRAPGLVLGMQADMWDPTAEQSAFEAVKAVIAERAEEFGRPVLLLQGDSHLFKIDRPAGMRDNLTRVVVQGSTNLPHEWTKLTVDPSRPGVFSCQARAGSSRRRRPATPSDRERGPTSRPHHPARGWAQQPPRVQAQRVIPAHSQPTRGYRSARTATVEASSIPPEVSCPQFVPSS